MSQLIAIFNESDANNDGLLNLTEIEHFLPLVIELDDHDGHDDHHNDEDEGHHHHGDEDYHHQHSDDDTSSHADYDRHHNHSHDDDIDGDDVPTPQDALNFTDANNDSLMSWDEFWHAWEDEDDEDEHDDHGDEHDGHKEDPVAFATLHIEEEGDYGFALPSGIEYFILMGEGGHDDHSDHGHGDHGDHGDEHAVCHDTTNHVNTEHDNEADCEAAGHMWMEDHDEGPCHDMNTHNSTEHDNETDCEAAGHLWTGDHSDDGSEIVAEEGEEAFEYDPHSWLSPVAYKAQLNVVLESLVTVFPDGEADFRANAEAYSAELDKLDLDYTAAFGAGGTCEVKNAEKTVVANHNAYAYISQRYDIEILTVHGIDPEGEPSAADIAEVVEQIKEKNITVLYVEEYTDTSSVDSIAQQTGVTIEILYTMELPPKNSEDNYLTLMNKNLDSLVAGMGC